MQKIIADKLLKDKSIQYIINNKKTKSFQITGLNESSEMALLSVYAQNQSLLFIVPDELKAREYQNIWQAFSKLPVYNLASRELIFTDVVAVSRDIELQRMAILQKLFSNEPGLFIITANSMLDYYPDQSFFNDNTLIFEYGKTYNFKSIQTKLLEIGYERISQIESAGQYAIRGDLIDIGISVADSISEVQGIRLSFFDDELESIRTFDPDTQRSIDNLSKIAVPPAKEWLITADEAITLAEKIKKVTEEQGKEALRQGAELETANAFERLGKRDAARIEQGMNLAALDRWLFLLDNPKKRLIDLAKIAKIPIVLSEVLQIQKRLDAANADFYQQMQSYLEKCQVVKGSEKARLSSNEAWQGITEIPTIAFAQIDSSGNGISGAEKITFSLTPVDSYRSRENEFLFDWRNWSETFTEVFIFAGNLNRVEKLKKLKVEHQLTANISEESLSNGFIWDSVGLIVIGTQDLFGAEKKRHKRKKQGITIDFLSDLKPGEYVVHEDNGIGIYNGLKTLEMSGQKSDYLQISYAGKDQLYIPVDQLNQIQKYVSAGGGKPKLSKLDGQSWQNLKSRAQDSIKKLATNLIKLYAERMELKGFVFSPDTVWQEQFEEGFPFQETDDQLVAADEVKSDMEKDQVMDRLLCGDVGFGKTEIAFRAMFKAVMDSKQAAMLVPTTVLAQQHFENLKERVAEFPIRVALLSRFVPLKERKKTIRKIAAGEIDLVIGTHRILSNDIKFANLGLLVIDEEQRFGVDHKEGIKEKYPTVDVLSMTATPIPRTLHMSISGIRDISILEEAPSDRRPVQTFVMEFEKPILEEAILREVSRHGQVFYLFNNTHKIAEKAQKIREAMPGLKVEYAHGQMSEKELEDVIERFIKGEFDVLVCTTIIESGVDMPRVNTIIVENADRLGLAQLYQIRGRVGRSERQAYAYITYRPDHILNEEASKRLAAIRDYTELGSGFKIALRDLEVRGAGNLLGAEQHGHMESIGYELYCKMLEENVKDLKGEEIQPELIKEAQVEITLDARIPQSYIQTEGPRLDLYRRISYIRTIEDYRDLLDELIDRFGDPPKSVENLCHIALIRSLAGEMGIERIYPQKEDIIFSFGENQPDIQRLSDIMDQDHNKIIFNAGVKPYLLLPKGASPNNQIISKILKVLT